MYFPLCSKLFLTSFFGRFAINVHALQDECNCFYRWHRATMRINCYTLFNGKKNLLTLVYRLSTFSTMKRRRWERIEIFDVNCDRCHSRLLTAHCFFISFFFLLFDLIENCVAVNIERTRKLISRLHEEKMKHKMKPLSLFEASYYNSTKR